MHIEPIDGGSLRVWLSEEELQEWGLQAQTPDRRLVRRLVRQITETAGQPAGKVTAELIPVMGGGVLLISGRVCIESGQPAVYRLVSEDALLDLWERWPKKSPAPVSTLYEIGEDYWLAVYPDGPLTAEQRHLLLEYGIPLSGGEGAIAHAAEYGRVIAADVLTAGVPDPPELSDPVH